MNLSKELKSLKKSLFLLSIFLFSLSGCSSATDNVFKTSDEKINVSKNPLQPFNYYVYKTYQGKDLKLSVFEPSTSNRDNKKTAIVFFHSGSWKNGNPNEFYRQSKYFAEFGIVSINVDYRLKNRDHTTPFEAVADAKSAIRWVRKNAVTLKIDPNHIIAAGGSAGGQLAIATQLIQDINDQRDDLSVSPIPNALILFNPVLDMTKWENEFKLKLNPLSPIHQLKKPLPPIIILQGTDDRVTEYENTLKFVEMAKKIGTTNIELETYSDRGHGFYSEKLDFNKTLATSKKFICKLGWFSCP